MAQGKPSKADVAAESAARLEIVRIFAAPRALVYEAWTTPEHLGQWSAPEGFTIPEARADFRKGGDYFARMRSPAGDDHCVRGKYLDMVEGKRIVMTHAWLDGACQAGPETTITVTFDDVGDGKTKMTFLQEGFTSALARDGHAEGWTSAFNLLAILLEKLRGGREFVISRLVNAPRELVFAAFKDPAHIGHWWGPNGFRTTTYEMDFRPGGQWLFTMHGPDGTDYPNRVRYTEIREPEVIAYDHDAGEGSDAASAFKQTITFEAEGGKTRVTLHLVMATAEHRAAMAKFGAVEGGHQTLARLAAYIGKA
ncbi:MULTISPECIES: SRPBCC domain-containing protein [unclassified Hyphomicrobium]|uniref:SRPBCC domain-containing protein n=1 Tax=unclassified Hyphomicrobium TaxID=2619925 RepID=UPI000213E217|nr:MULTISPECIES: SRPBCC domain-containing protein [unclassified Hyphomicrobium]CCB67073.1 conserved protein of unknown function [Hyphomicrobium sp. MC1]